MNGSFFDRFRNAIAKRPVPPASARRFQPLSSPKQEIISGISSQNEHYIEPCMSSEESYHIRRGGLYCRSHSTVGGARDTGRCFMHSGIDRLVCLSVTLAFLLSPLPATFSQEAGLRGFTSDETPSAAGVGGEVPCHSAALEPARVHGSELGRAAPCREGRAAKKSPSISSPSMSPGG